MERGAEWCLPAVNWDRVTLETDINVIPVVSSHPSLSAIISQLYSYSIHENHGIAIAMSSSSQADTDSGRLEGFKCLYQSHCPGWAGAFKCLIRCCCTDWWYSNV